jgi:transposase
MRRLSTFTGKKGLDHTFSDVTHFLIFLLSVCRLNTPYYSVQFSGSIIDREKATKILDNIIFNLKVADDAELVRWGNTLKKWREPILNYFHNRTTNGYTEGCNTKIKMLKRISYGLGNVEVYWRKMLLGFIPRRECFHTI